VGLTSIQKANLEKAAKAAWESQQIAPFPGLLTLAQWALESGWGTKQPGQQLLRDQGLSELLRSPVLEYLGGRISQRAQGDQQAALRHL
jgi:hypothetical protein